LDPNRRGERLDECDAIEMFLADALSGKAGLELLKPALYSDMDRER
jgi:hypothetical protein